MHSLRPSLSMCIFTTYDHQPAKTNRSNFIEDVRCSDPVISHDGALEVPPRSFYSLPKLRVQLLAALPSVIEDKIVGSPPIVHIYLLPITILSRLCQAYSYNTVFIGQRILHLGHVKCERHLHTSVQQSHKENIASCYKIWSEQRQSTSIKHQRQLLEPLSMWPPDNLQFCGKGNSWAIKCTSHAENLAFVRLPRTLSR